MCTARGGDIDDLTDSFPKSVSDVTLTCMKCGVLPAVMARMKDPFCQSCFEVYFAHRFRATFGKAKIVRQGEKALVCFSGGASSRVLLKLIEDGLHKDAAKKLRFDPTIIYIDESVLLESGSSSSQYKFSLEHTCNVLNTAAQAGFPVIFTRLEEVLGSCNFWYLSDILKHFSSCHSVVSESKPVETAGSSRSEMLSEGFGNPLLVTENDIDLIQDRSLPKAEKEMSEEEGIFTCMPMKQQSRENLLSPEVIPSIGKELDTDDTQPDVEASSSPVTVKTTTEHSSIQCDTHSIRDSISRQCPVSAGLQEELCRVFSAAKTATAKEHLLHLFRRKLFERAALRLGLSKIIVGDNASLLSVRLLGNIAQGRGATVPLDTAFCDDRGEIAVLRPLREFPQSEIASYCSLFKLDVTDLPNLFKEEKSINRLTESFINGLQADFPSTTSTIFRTSDKLSLADDVQAPPIRCSLCQVPVGPPPDGDVFNHICGVKEYVDLATLCYGCSLTLKDLTVGKEVIESLKKLDDK